MKTTINPTHSLTCTKGAGEPAEAKAHGKKHLHYLIDHFLRLGYVHFTIAKIEYKQRVAQNQLDIFTGS